MSTVPLELCDRCYQRTRRALLPSSLSSYPHIYHNIYNKRCLLPCTYGYATTIRCAQGATYHHGCIWFDHTYPAERGYGYVAASRFKSKAGIYLFGKIRRTDWLPVPETVQSMEQDQIDRSEESISDYDSEDEERECLRDYDDDSQQSISGESLSLIHI